MSSPPKPKLKPKPQLPPRTHLYPPSDRPTRSHAPSSSISSFQSVSLSSDTDALTESYETITLEPKTIPPKLPKRPTKPSPLPPPYPIRHKASGSHSTPPSPIIKPTASYTPRRVAPPPPPSRLSDRSSSLSSSSQSHQSRNLHSPSVLSLKIKRPTPVPLAARKRYEVVFNANVIQRRKAEKGKLREKPPLLSVAEARSRRALGWRGLSVDLLTSNDVSNGSIDIDDIIGPDEKLEGPIIRQIWKRSGLDNSRLAEIWNGCDLTSQGALSLEAFVQGMWRIDEELRRVESQNIKAASNLSLSSYRSNTHRSDATPKPRDILR